MNSPELSIVEPIETSTLAIRQSLAPRSAEFVLRVPETLVSGPVVTMYLANRFGVVRVVSQLPRESRWCW